MTHASTPTYTYSDVAKMIDHSLLGVTRCGASGTQQILEEANRRLAHSSRE